ncbi:Lysosomal-trafficking regulator [Trichinella patagoniensis]|uniref:Lysosomal-trafficking regulator n=1 Tax=Trichinella patagoniensis TaxID=990121 RepID=A0A0V1A614_9BILA|nr:Lysosomal-trafficking regulator [Trichinella patagoniensis]KRY19811.1 Lysosomal-trafficking regulator [Trichinella patagoniensis]
MSDQFTTFENAFLKKVAISQPYLCQFLVEKFEEYLYVLNEGILTSRQAWPVLNEDYLPLCCVLSLCKWKNVQKPNSMAEIVWNVIKTLLTDEDESVTFSTPLSEANLKLLNLLFHYAGDQDLLEQKRKLLDYSSVVRRTAEDSKKSNFFIKERRAYVKWKRSRRMCLDDSNFSNERQSNIWKPLYCTSTSSGDVSESGRPHGRISRMKHDSSSQPCLETNLWYWFVEDSDGFLWDSSVIFHAADLTNIIGRQLRRQCRLFQSCSFDQLDKQTACCILLNLLARCINWCSTEDAILSTIIHDCTEWILQSCGVLSELHHKDGYLWLVRFVCKLISWMPVSGDYYFPSIRIAQQVNNFVWKLLQCIVVDQLHNCIPSTAADQSELLSDVIFTACRAVVDNLLILIFQMSAQRHLCDRMPALVDLIDSSLSSRMLLDIPLQVVSSDVPRLLSSLDAWNRYLRDALVAIVDRLLKLNRLAQHQGWCSKSKHISCGLLAVGEESTDCITSVGSCCVILRIEEIMFELVRRTRDNAPDDRFHTIRALFEFQSCSCSGVVRYLDLLVEMLPRCGSAVDRRMLRRCIFGKLLKQRSNNTLWNDCERFDLASSFGQLFDQLNLCEQLPLLNLLTEAASKLTSDYKAQLFAGFALPQLLNACRTDNFPVRLVRALYRLCSTTITASNYPRLVEHFELFESHLREIELDLVSAELLIEAARVERHVQEPHLVSISDRILMQTIRVLNLVISDVRLLAMDNCNDRVTFWSAPARLTYLCSRLWPLPHFAVSFCQRGGVELIHGLVASVIHYSTRRRLDLDATFFSYVEHLLYITVGFCASITPADSKIVNRSIANTFFCRVRNQLMGDLTERNPNNLLAVAEILLRTFVAVQLAESGNLLDRIKVDSGSSSDVSTQSEEDVAAYSCVSYSSAKETALQIVGNSYSIEKYSLAIGQWSIIIVAGLLKRGIENVGKFFQRLQRYCVRYPTMMKTLLEHPTSIENFTTILKTIPQCWTCEHVSPILEAMLTIFLSTNDHNGLRLAFQLADQYGSHTVLTLLRILDQSLQECKFDPKYLLPLNFPWPDDYSHSSCSTTASALAAACEKKSSGQQLLDLSFNSTCSSYYTSMLRMIRMKTSAPVMINLKKYVKRANMRQGLSVGIWLRCGSVGNFFNQACKRREQAHVVSIGNAKLLCSVNVGLPGLELILSLNFNGQQVVSYKCGSLHADRWCLLFLQMRYANQKLFIQLNFNDSRIFRRETHWNAEEEDDDEEEEEEEEQGVEDGTDAFRHFAIALFGRRKLFRLFGHVASINVFNECLSDNYCTLLYELGPRRCNLALNENGELLNLNLYCSSKRKLYSLFDDEDALIRLSERLVAVMTGQKMIQFCAYPNKRYALNCLCNVVVDHDDTTLSDRQQQTLLIDIVDPCGSTQLYNFLQSCGSAMILLYLVIQVIDCPVLHKPIDEQSRSFALRFLVLCVQRNPIWRDEFVKMLGPAMLSYFTGESQFPVGSDFVKTLFDLCVSCSHSGCPLICEVEILFQMLTSFQLWRNGLEQFAEALLLLANLLEASSENVTICNQFSLIKRLLNLICIYIRITGKDFSSSLINAITRVVQAVLSGGIWFTEVSVVIEFLFYCHDASRVTVQYPFCNAFTWINLSLIETFVNGLLKIRDECENELLIKDDCGFMSSMHLYDAASITKQLHNTTISDVFSKYQLFASAGKMFFELIEPSLRPSSKGIETFPAFVRLKCEILHLLIAHMNNIENGEQLTNVPNCDIRWEYLIVMLRQQVDRQTVGYLVELLAVTLHWFSDDQKEQFLNARGFDLLRNQLYQLPTSITVINSLLQLVLGGQTSYFSNNNNNNKFEDQQLFQDHISNLMTIDEFQTEALSVLVAQLECSIVDCTTFNSLIDLLTEISKNDQIASTLWRVGLTDCLVAALMKLPRLNVEKDEDRQQQVMVNVRGAWRRFAVSVFRKALLSAEEQAFKCAAVGFLELLMLADLQLYVGGKVVKQKLIRDELVNLLGELLTTYRQVSWLKRWDGRKSSTSCRRHRRSSGEAGESEIMASRLEDRLVECLELCNNFILFMPPNVGPDNDEELLLFQSYFSFLIDLIPDSFLLTKDPPNGPKKRLAIFALVKNLFVFLVHPSILLTFRQLWDRLHGNFRQTAGNCCDCSRRFVMVEQLQRNPKAREVLKSFLSTLPEYRDLLLHIFCDFSVCTTLTEADKAALAAFLRLDFLQASSVSSSKLSSSGQCKIELAPAKSSLKKFYHLTCSWVSGMFERKKRILQDSQARLHSTNEQASDVNRFTVYMHDVITSEYASFEHNSNRLAENVLWQWRFIEKSLCHPQGIFYSPKKWPNRWYLDPLHLPGYSRVRFTPDVMDNDSEFYRSQETGSSIKGCSSFWLDKLFATSTLLPFDTEGGVLHSFNTIMVTLFFEATGTLLLYRDKIHFLSNNCCTVQKRIPLNKKVSTSWNYSQLILLNCLRFHAADSAVEMFFDTLESCLFVFDSPANRAEAVGHLKTFSPSLQQQASLQMLSTFTEAWRYGRMTNFDYIITLNELAGRTFNDITQYPVFPFILNDYLNYTIDLKQPTLYRDLSLPVAVQNSKSRTYYSERYEALSSASLDQNVPLSEPYHFSALYSNSGVVLYYMIRVPPFSNLALEYHGSFYNTFDMPDRLFHSINTTWNMASWDWRGDNKELIPEFFTLPEMFINTQNFNLGIRHNGERVHDVIMPNWCPEKDPRLFVLIHRQALESEAVSKRLSHWIDLIFGYRQSGQAAVEAFNVYHPCTSWKNVRFEELGDEISSSALHAMVKTFGQLPLQLFTKPHPPRTISTNNDSNSTTASAAAPRPPPTSEYSFCPARGLRWGNYVGSPEGQAPRLICAPTVVIDAPSQLAHVFILPCGNLVFVPDKVALVAVYPCKLYPNRTFFSSVRQQVRLRTLVSIVSLRFDFADCVIKLKFEHLPTSAGRISESDLSELNDLMLAYDFQVTAYSSFVETTVFCFGTDLGTLNVVRLKWDYFPNVVKHLQAQNLQANCTVLKTLYGHSASVSTVAQSTEHGIIVSGSAAGELFVWDLNRLCFVRKLTGHEGTLSLCAISSGSSSSCDIVSVSDEDVGSELILHTVNGRLVGRVHSSVTICSLALSTLSEGVSINCIAAGLQNGVIKIWDRWKLSLIQELRSDEVLRPVISLAYTCNCSQLVALLNDNTIICWDKNADTTKSATNHFKERLSRALRIT